VMPGLFGAGWMARGQSGEAPRLLLPWFPSVRFLSGNKVVVWRCFVVFLLWVSGGDIPHIMEE